MRTKANHKKRINIYTLGCSKNVYDSEVLMGQIKASGLEVVHEATPSAGDTIVINTCGFIANAKEESVNTILSFADAKEKGEISSLFVTGCLSQRYKGDLEKEIGEVDEWFGTSDLVALLAALGADYKHQLIGESRIATPKHYAYLKISEGCDRPCAFCAIPIMRGKHVSRSIESLVVEAEKMAANGTQELILIAQDSTYYGIDLYGERCLAKLLDALSNVEGIERIRLQYAYPSKFPLDILPLIREKENLCKYLDMPLQHISDNVLKTMRRGITKARTLDLIKTIREEVPGIALRTTLLVGHPGETEADFEELKEFVKNTRFDRLGVFAYSHEEQTHAYTLKDDVPEDVKQERAAEIMAIQNIISRENNEAMIGKEINVMIDRIEGDYFVGRSEFDSPEVDNEILIDANENYLRIGTFAKVKITKAEDYDLYAEPLVVQNS